MANPNIQNFIDTYGPVAQQVSRQINVDPNVLLSQWGLESRWGQTEMAKKYHNLGGIKDFSGKGHKAKDNKTGSTDAYLKFEDPELFGTYYADMIKRNYPSVVNTGPDIGAFTRGLGSGSKGSYFGIPAQEYEQSLSSAYAAIPEDKMLPFTPTANEKPPGREGDMVLADAPQSPPASPDISGAGPGERFLAGGIGAGVGAAASGVSGASNALINRAGVRAGVEENARIAAQRAAGVPAGAAPAVPTVPTGSVPSGGPSGGRLPIPTVPTGSVPSGGPSGGRLPIPTGPADAGRMAQGQTGVIPYNTAKALGVTDIEAGQALTNTKQAGGAWDIAKKRADALKKLQGMGMSNFYENPMYGGIMTEAPSASGGPRKSFSMKAPIAPSPDLPLGQPGGLSQLPPRQPIPTAPVAPVAAPLAPAAASGLDSITELYRSMMRTPVGRALGTIGRYSMPPLAGLSAGLDVAEMGHEYDKPPEQRDPIRMGLKGASALGAGLSLFPPTAPVGIPLALGATAADMYRSNPEFRNIEPTEETAPVGVLRRTFAQ